MELTDNTEPTKLLRKWAGVSAIAAVLKRKCFFQWADAIYPNFYIVLVGNPGMSRKGSAVDKISKLLRRLNIRLAAERITNEALIQELEECKDMLVDQTNVGVAKPNFHCSLTVLSGELAVFLGYNNPQFLSDLCDLYDCKDRWTYRTKNKNTNYLSGVWLNLIGCTTPKLLRKLLADEVSSSASTAAVGGGLASRVIFVYAAGRGKRVAIPIPTVAELQLFETLLHDLDLIGNLRGRFVADESWVDLYVPWYEEQDNHPLLKHEQLQHYIARRQIHLIKLCMVLSASRSDGMVLQAVDFVRASKLLAETEELMPKVYEHVGQNTKASILASVQKTIAAKGNIELGELIRLYLDDADKNDMQKILATLEAMHYIKIEYKQTGQVILHYNERQ